MFFDVEHEQDLVLSWVRLISKGMNMYMHLLM